LLKNLVHKGVNFEAQNALKLTYEHFYFQKKSGGYTSGPPLKGRGEGREEKDERDGAKEGRPLPIRIPGYATAGPLARKYSPDFPYS